MRAPPQITVLITNGFNPYSLRINGRNGSRRITADLDPRLSVLIRQIRGVFFF